MNRKFEGMVQASRGQVPHRETLASHSGGAGASKGPVAAGTPYRIQHELSGVTLLQRAREVARLRHLSLSTEESYLLTVRRFIRFHGGLREALQRRASVRPRVGCNAQ